MAAVLVLMKSLLRWEGSDVVIGMRLSKPKIKL
jgi:hypothetical protein